MRDARRYAKAVEAAGGFAELHVWQGMLHVFASSVGTLDAATQALDLTGAFLRRHLVVAAMGDATQ